MTDIGASLGAAERDEFLRAAWRLLFAGRVDAGRLVFVDEMGANVSLSPLYAWSRRGERAHAKAPRNWGKNVTLLASITAGGVGPCLAVEGPTTRGVFETYLERVLALEPLYPLHRWAGTRTDIHVTPPFFCPLARERTLP